MCTLSYFGGKKRRTGWKPKKGGITCFLLLLFTPSGGVPRQRCSNLRHTLVNVSRTASSGEKSDQLHTRRIKHAQTARFRRDFGVRRGGVCRGHWTGAAPAPIVPARDLNLIVDADGQGQASLTFQLGSEAKNMYKIVHTASENDVLNVKTEDGTSVLKVAVRPLIVRQQESKRQVCLRPSVPV